MKRTKLMGTVALLALLGGCMGDQVEALRHGAEGEGAGFTAELSREYKQLAFYEADQMHDWIDADRFAEKAPQTAGGESVAPESLENWALPEDKESELEEAHGRLLAVLGKGAAKKAPLAAARAQAGFDCWLEQQEENHQPAHIAACREAFLANLQAVEAALQPPAKLVPAKATTGTEPAQRFTLHFDFDSDSLDPNAVRQLERAIEAAAGNKAVTIDVTGHADRAGSEDYNLRLSLGRANAVLEALTAKGIDPDRITITGRGETMLAVETDDGAQEAANRRVEIEVR